jgi:hypothetical protein
VEGRGAGRELSPSSDEVGEADAEAYPWRAEPGSFGPSSCSRDEEADEAAGGVVAPSPLEGIAERPMDMWLSSDR